MTSADLAVLLLPAGALPSSVQTWRSWAGEAVPVLVVQGKAHVVSDGMSGTSRLAPLTVSGLTGEGVPALLREITARLMAGGAAGAAVLVSEGHADALRRAADSPERAV